MLARGADAGTYGRHMVNTVEESVLGDDTQCCCTVGMVYLCKVYCNIG